MTKASVFFPSFLLVQGARSGQAYTDTSYGIGRGTRVQGTFNLAAGTMLSVVVGQHGGYFPQNTGTVCHPSVGEFKRKGFSFLCLFAFVYAFRPTVAAAAVERLCG
jgi:hypothetical protein